MIVDTRSVDQYSKLFADVCIVGGGTSGIVMASDLINSKLKVIIIESGGLKPDKSTEFLNYGENIGLKYYSLDTARARYYGGSTNRWHVSLGKNELGARIRPLDAIDFEERDYIPNSGWPFSKKHLDYYYAKAQEVCRTTPISYDVEHWFKDSLFQKFPFDDNLLKTIVFKFTSKNSILKGHGDAIKDAENIQLMLYANAIEIETDDEANRVTGMKVACNRGKQLHVSAKIYVLAVGGIEVPRLMLCSNKVMKWGVGNQNDLVGRYFMEHLHFWSGIFIPVNNTIISQKTMYNQIQRINNVPVIAKIAVSESAMHKNKLINHNVQLIPRWIMRSNLYTHLYSNLANDSGQMVKKILSGVQKGFIKAAKVIDRRKALVYIFANMTEQIPNPESRITLGSDQDMFGLPRVKLDWQVTQQDIMNAFRVQKIIADEIDRNRLGKFYIQLRKDMIPQGLHGGYHHMGTTRMSQDPKKGVVDSDCRVHGITNLYIAGPSVFPTGGHANPVLTIIALTLRLSEHMQKILSV